MGEISLYCFRCFNVDRIQTICVKKPQVISRKYVEKSIFLSETHAVTWVRFLYIVRVVSTLIES